MMGLLVLLKDHRGEDDVARLGDDLDLEIDEILPAIDFAEALELVRVSDGRMTFTEVGRRLVDATIRERKTILRDQLKRTKLYATLVRALESAPGGRLSDDEANRIIAFTAAPADDAVLNIINWGRFVELFRYDPEDHILSLIRHRAAKSSTPAVNSPPPGPAEPVLPSTRVVPAPAPAADSTMRTAIVTA